MYARIRNVVVGEEWSTLFADRETEDRREVSSAED